MTDADIHMLKGCTGGDEAGAVQLLREQIVFALLGRVTTIGENSGSAIKVSKLCRKRLLQS